MHRDSHDAVVARIELLRAFRAASAPGTLVVRRMSCVRRFLCGDVMLGRGIDQILPHPNRPHLFESYMRSASGYVRLAEAKTGPLPECVPFSYVWGDAPL